MAQKWQRTCLPVKETWFQSLSREDPLEKEMTTHSSILVCEIPWAEEPGGLQSTGSQVVRNDLATEHGCTLEIFTEDLCVCVCVCACVYICVCMYACVYVCVCVCMCIYMCVYACVYIHVCMHVYMCACVYMYVCVCVYDCICVCVYIYIYIYIYMCMYIYILHFRKLFHLENSLNSSTQIFINMYL